MVAPVVSASLNDELRKIVSRIVDVYQPERVILFGSYAYGSPHADSDLDLLILKETDETPRQRRFVIRKLLWQLPLDKAIEPLVLTPAELEQRLRRKDQFIQEIVSRGHVLYG